MKQGGKCALSGTELVLCRRTTEYLKGMQTASIDRIYCHKPYCIDNIQWIHKKLNWMKNRIPQEEFIDLCIKVTNFQRKRSKND
jgi:hypothetical protein